MGTSDWLSIIAIIITIIGGFFNYIHERRLRILEREKTNVSFIFDEILLKEYPICLYDVCYSNSLEANQYLQDKLLEIKKLTFVFYFYDNVILSEIYDLIIKMDDYVVMLPVSKTKENDINQILKYSKQIYTLLYKYPIV